MTNTAHKRKVRRKSTEQTPIRAAIIGLAATAITSAVTILFFSMILYTTPNPGSIVLAGGLAALYVSSFIGGLTSAFAYRDAPLLCGFLTGAAVFVSLILLSLILPTKKVTDIAFLLSAGLHLLSIPFSLLGAYSANSLIRSGTQRKRKKRR